MVSVIVPVYNPGEWFEDCINSILEQTYQHIEVILVDDGSTDGSEKKCDLYAEQDDRVQVIHVKNGGVSKARNIGIQAAKGDFLLFIDSDDWIEENLLTDALRRIETDESELAIYAMQIDKYKNGNITTKDMRYKKDTVFLPEEIADNFEELYYNDYLSSSCTKVFQKSIIDMYQLKFDENLVMYEDLCFVLEYISKCNRVSILKEAYYHYRMDDTILAVSKRKTDNLLKNLENVVNKIISFLSEKKGTISEKDNNIVVDLFIIYLHKLFAQKNSMLIRMKGIRQLEKEQNLQQALKACPKFTEGSKFYKLLVWSLKRKATIVTFLLYWKRYRASY